MRDNKDIGKVYKEKLDTLSESPNDTVWENIASKLDSLSADLVTTKIPLWKILMGVAITSTVIFIIANKLIIPKNSPTNINTIISPSDSLANIESSKFKVNNNINGEEEKDNKIKNLKLEEVNNGLVQNKTEKVENKYLNKSNKVSNLNKVSTFSNKTTLQNKVQLKKNTKKQKINQNSKKIINFNKANTILDKKTINETLSKNLKHKISENSKEITLKKLNDTVLIQGNNNYKKENNSQSINNSKIIILDKKINIKDSKIVSHNDINSLKFKGKKIIKINTEWNNIKPKTIIKKGNQINLISELRSIKRKVKEENDGVKKWKISTKIAPMNYSFRKKTPIEGNGNGIVTVSLGIEADYLISKKIYLRTGINRIGTTSLNEVIEVSTYGRSSVSTNLVYLEIPLNLKYRVFNKRLSIDLITGGSILYNLIDDYYAKIISGVEDHNPDSTVTSQRQINVFSYSANFGIEFDYKLNKRFSVNIEPMYKFHLNADKTENYKPYIFGAYTGFSYHF